MCRKGAAARLEGGTQASITTDCTRMVDPGARMENETPAKPATKGRGRRGKASLANESVQEEAGPAETGRGRRATRATRAKTASPVATTPPRRATRHSIAQKVNFHVSRFK